MRHAPYAVRRMPCACYSHQPNNHNKHNKINKHNKPDMAAQPKLTGIGDVVNGKNIIVVDDSVVRGTTTRGKMNQLRKAGAKEIHLRISCPPIRDACYFGVDFPDKSKLIATGRTVEEIRQFLGVDSLHYLSLEGMLSCVTLPPENFCHACFSGQYRIPVDKQLNKLDLEQHQLKMFD